MYTEDQLLPLSALQHLLFCERQCALIHVEQVWAENKFTAEGRVMHERTHEPGHEKRPGVKITRSLPVRSLSLGISGQCDVVEFHDDGSILPVEYKRGKPKAHRADEVQVCAQAMAIEEMRSLPDGHIRKACLFYGKNRRRLDVTLDGELRQLTQSLAVRLQVIFSSGQTPSAVYEAVKCDACSLNDICQPRAMRFKRGAAAWFAMQTEGLHFKSQI